MSGLGLESALSALQAAGRGLQVTGQNLAGSDVQGYVRRRVEATTVGPAAGVSRLWATVPGDAPNGVSTNVARLADAVLDARSRVETGRAGTAATVATGYARLEQVFDEPSDTGLASALDDLWQAFAAAGVQPGAATGAVVVQRAGAVVDRLHASADALDATVADARTTLRSDVDTAAHLAARVGVLNQAIVAASASTSDTADLLDQRDRALDQLADLVGARTTIAADGSATVTVDGTALVTGSTVGALAVGDDDTVTVDGATVALTAGDAAGQLTTITATVPAYRARLDAVANALRDTVDTALQGGYTATGSPGGPLFSGSGAGDLALTGLGADQLGLYDAPGTTSTGVATTLATTGTRTDGPDAGYRELVATLGAESARAAGHADALGAAAATVTGERLSAEGVNVDEELTAMLGYQRAYQAASRVLTTVDEMLDQLVNRTGRVGL